LQVFCLTRLSLMAEAQEAAEIALDYARKYADPDVLAKTLGNVFTYYQGVDISRAVEVIEESIEILDQLGEHNLKATSMINLGYIYTQSGLFQRGEETFKKSLELAEQLENPRLIAYNQLNLGLAYYRLEEYQVAQGLLERTLIACDEIEDNFAKGSCLTYLGLNFEGVKNYILAEGNYQKAWETLNQVGAPGFAMDARAGMARCALENDHLERAETYSNEVCGFLGEDSAQGMEFPILAYLTCARVYEKLGDQERRVQSIENGRQQLMERAQNISDPVWQKVYLEQIPEHQEILDAIDNLGS
jgi:tetratricopeptide (TPR) repeat protein